MLEENEVYHNEKRRQEDRIKKLEDKVVLLDGQLERVVARLFSQGQLKKEDLPCAGTCYPYGCIPHS